MQGLLHEHCTLTQQADGVFERTCDKTWWGHGALFGGYVQAMALSAMTQALRNADQLPQSMTMHFLRPFLDGPFRAETTVERTGRNMSNVSARLHSGGKLAGLAITSFGTWREFNEFRALAPPDDAPVQPGEAPVVTPLGVPTHDHFDMFPASGRSPAVAATPMWAGGWYSATSARSTTWRFPFWPISGYQRRTTVGPNPLPRYRSISRRISDRRCRATTRRRRHLSSSIFAPPARSADSSTRT